MNARSASIASSTGSLSMMRGAPSASVAAASAAAGAGEVLAIARSIGPDCAGRLAGLIASQAREVALATLAGAVAVDVAVFDRDGGLIGHAGP